MALSLTRLYTHVLKPCPPNLKTLETDFLGKIEFSVWEILLELLAATG